MAESTRRRPFFPDAFKQEAVAAVRGGRPVSQVAAELGLPDRLLRWWLRWDERGGAAVRGAGTDAPQRAGGAGASGSRRG
jgi:transposase